MVTVSGVTGLLNWYVRIYWRNPEDLRKAGSRRSFHRNLSRRVWLKLWGHGAGPRWLPVRARGKHGFHRRQDHETAPEQGGPCLEASHSSCQLINLLFAVLLLLFPEGTLDRVFHIFIAKKKKKVNTTLGKPRHPIEKEILFPVSG